MENDTEGEASREVLARLETDSAAYFQKAGKCVGDRDAHYGVSEPDFFWSMLPDKLHQKADKMVAELQKIVPTIIAGVQRSPVLTEADQRDVGHAVKTMRAALRLRRYQFWDIEVLHDEGTVLGVQRPRQSEDEPLHPDNAAEAFAEQHRRLTDLIGLTSSVSGGVPDVIKQAQSSTSSYRRGTAFIMMWMDRGNPSLDDVADAVRRCFDRFGIKAVRSDEIQHEDVITKRILEEIRTAEFLFADLTGERPSVYYEVGYAHAIGRRVILFRKRGARIHFDLAGYNCPEYQNLRDLEEQLRKRLQHVTGEIPKAEQDQVPAREARRRGSN